MKVTNFKLFIPLILVSLLSYSFRSNDSSQINLPTNSTEIEEDTNAFLNKDKYPSIIRSSSKVKWKTFESKKYHFSFQYPANWKENGSINASINLQGDTVAISMALQGNDLSFTLHYYLAPQGSKLHEYAVQQFRQSEGIFKAGSEKIRVAGQKALKTKMTIDRDGKGKLIHPPQKKVIVLFLDQNQGGEFRIELKTQGEEVKLNILKTILASFEFRQQPLIE